MPEPLTLDHDDSDDRPRTRLERAAELLPTDQCPECQSPPGQECPPWCDGGGTPARPR